MGPLVPDRPTLASLGATLVPMGWPLVTGRAPLVPAGGALASLAAPLATKGWPLVRGEATPASLGPPFARMGTTARIFHTHCTAGWAAGRGFHPPILNATLRHLQIKVVGVDSNFRVVREMSLDDVANGVEIGPFAAGQQVIVRTDVGNSRDSSEISAEQSIVIA